MSRQAIAMCDCDKGTNLDKPTRVYKPTEINSDGETCSYCDYFVKWELPEKPVFTTKEVDEYEIHLEKRNTGRYYYE